MAMKYDLENFAPYIVSTLSRLFADLLEQSLKAKGLTLSHWRILLCLEKHEKRNLNQIVEFTLLNQSTLSRSINRMEERGLITKEKHQGDARNCDIRISQLGKQKIEKTYASVQKACAEPLKILSAEEKDAWMKTMKKIIQNLEKSKT